MVVYYHSISYFPDLFGGAIVVAQVGFVGVDLFFVISGFIMWYTSANKAGLRDALRFQLQRFGRIFLGYWPFFFLSVIAFILIDDRNYSFESVLKSFFLWPQALTHTLLPVSWTLSFELYFYTIFALLLVFSRLERRMSLLLLVAVVVLICNLVAYFSGFYSKDEFPLTDKLSRMIISPLVLEFFAGCMIGYWVRHARVRIGAYILFAGIVGLVGIAAYQAQLPVEQSLALGYNVQLRVALIITPAAAMVAGLAFLEKEGFVFFPRAGIVLGGASYSIYLLHTIVLHLGPGTWWKSGDIGSASGVYASFIVTTALIVSLSAIYFVFMEKPVYDLYKRAVVRLIPVVAVGQRAVSPGVRQRSHD